MKRKGLKMSVKKRALSLILALSMLAAIAPQPLEPLFAFAQEPERSLVYDLRKGYPVTDLSTITYDMTDSYDDKTDGELNTDILSDPWMPININSVGIAKRSQLYINLPNAVAKYSRYSANIGMAVLSAYDNGPVISVKVEKGGKYIPAVTVCGNWLGEYTSGANMALYFGKVKEGTNYIVSGFNNGEPVVQGEVLASTDNINAAGINGPMTVYLTDTPIELEAGEYAFQIGGTGQHDAVYPGMAYPYSYVKDLRLVTEEDFSEKIEVSENAEPEKLVYDFTALNTADMRNSQAKVDAITYQNTLNDAGAAWAVYSYYKNGPLYDGVFWGSDDLQFYYKTEGKGLTLQSTSTYGSGSIVLHVPADGYYTAEVVSANPTNNAFYSDIFLMPLKADRSVGTATTTAAEDKALSVRVMGSTETAYKFNNGAPIELKAGEYVLYVNHINTLESYINSLTLTPVEIIGIEEKGVAVKNGESAVSDVTAAKLDGTEVSMANATNLSVTVEDTSVATATASVSGDKLAISVTGGTKTGFTRAKISAVTAAGEMVEDVIGIFVNPLARVGGEHVIWDFRKGHHNTAAVDVNYIPTITYSHTTFGNDGELNPSVYSEPWAAHKVANGDTYYLDGYQNLGLRIIRGTATDSFKLKLNESGSFIPAVTVVSSWDGAGSGLNASFTLSKLEGSTETPICSAEGINTGAIEGPITIELSDKAIDLEAGEYVLTIKGSGLYTGGKAAMLYLQKFRMMTSVENKLEKNAVAAEDLNYNFTALNTAERRNSQEAVDRISYADTLAANSSPWRVYSTVYGRWVGRVKDYYNGHEPALTYDSEGTGLFSTNAGQGQNTSATIMLHVPADGYYAATLDAQLRETAGKTAYAYIYKLNDNRSIGAKAAEVTISGEGTSWKFNGGVPMKLDAGEYVLHVWHGPASPSTDIRLNSLKLQAAKVENTIDADAIAVKTRDTASGTFDVLDKDGNPISITAAYSAVNVADTSVADLSIEVKDGKISYTLTGKATGYTTADIIVIDSNNIGAAATVEIYVNTAGRVGGESIIYDFRKVNVGNGDIHYLKTITYDHTTKGNDKELNPSLPSEPWASHNLASVNAWNFVCVLNGYQNGGIDARNNVGNPSLKFKITESGTFMPRLHIAGTYNYTMGGQNVTFKLSKLNADGSLTDVSTTERVGGDVIDGVMRVELADAPMQFTEGEEYVLTIMGKGQWPNSRSNGYIIWLQKLELVDASAYEAKLAVNETEAASLTYDFSVLNDENHRGAQDIMDAITYADVIKAGNSAPWKPYTAYARNFITSTEFFKDHETAFLYTTENAGITLNGRAGAVMMHVPADGDYIVSFDAQAIGSNASGIEAKLMPVTSRRTVENAIAEETVTLTTADGAKTYQFNGGLPLNLKAGEYLLYLFSANGSDITLNKVDMEVCDISLSVDDADITAKPRETSTGTISFFDANGEKVNVGGGQVWFTSSDASVAEMTGEIKDGAISYTLTSKGAGDCEIEIFALDENGKGAQGKVKIYVNKNARVGAEIPIYDFRKINIGTDPTDMNYPNSITYNHTMVGGTREVNPGMYSEPWAAVDLYSQDAWNYVGVLNNYQSMGMRFFNLKSPRSMKFRVDEAGTYIPTIIVAGTWTQLAGMNAQFEFGYNAPNGYRQLGLVKEINASAIDGYFTVELTDGPIEMAEGEYVLTITSNGYWDFDKYPYHSIWLKSMELREPREELAVNEEDVKDLVYNFAALNDDAHRGYQDAANAITYSETVAAGSAPWELYSSTTAGYVSNKAFFGEYDPAIYYDAENRGLSMIGYSGAVRLHVPVDGWYTPSFELSSSGANAIDVYFMSLSGNGDPRDTVASMSFAPSTTVTSYTMNDGMPIHLTAGEYIVFVRAAAGNDVYLNSFTLDNNNAVLDINEEGVAAKTGETVSGSFVVYNDGEENDMTGGTVKFKVADPSVGDFNLTISGGKLVYSFKSLKRGTTTVQISAVDAKDNGLVKTISLSANPEGVLVGADQYYNFRKLEGTGGTYTLENVTDISMTTAGNAAEINPEIVTAPWSYISGSGKFVEYIDSDNGIMLALDGAHATFKIKVLNSGTYQVIPEGTVQANGGKVDVYIAPADAANATASEYYAGTADTYAYNRLAEQEFPLAIRKLTAGEYIVTLKLNGKSELVTVADTRADIVAFKLKAVDYYSSMTVLPEFYPGALKKGANIEIPIIVSESDAQTEWTPAVNAAVVSLDGSVATAEIISSEDKTEHTLNVTALKAGTTILTVTVTKENGDSAIVTIPITVTDTQAAASRTYRYRFYQTAYVDDDLKVIDSYSKVTPGSPDEYRNGSGTDRWYLSDQGKGFVRYFQDRADKAASIYISPNVGMYATITVELPESGIYEPQVPYEENTYGGIIRMWIAPVDAEDPKADEYSVGTLDSSLTNGLDKTAHFRSVALEAGEYKVTWEIIDNVAEVEGNASVPNFRPGGVDLVPQQSYPAINIEAEELPAIQLGTQANTALNAFAGATSGTTVYAVEDLFGAELTDNSDLVDVRLEWDENDMPYAAVTGVAQGDGDAAVSLVIDGEVRGSFTIPVTVAEAEPLKSVTLALKSNPTATLKIRDAGTYIADLVPTMYNTSGNIITADGAEAMGVIYKYTSSDESIATVSDTGAVTPVGIGNVTVTCEVTIGDDIASADLVVRVDDGKTESTYYTAEKKANAVENVKKYTWARSNLSSIEANLKPYLEPGMDEYLWNHLTTQELPRSYYVGSPSDPDAVSNVCRYCNANLTDITGVQHCPFIRDVRNSPWKLQCPECRRKFPSNDFGAFYELGIDEHGNWSYEQSKALGSHLLTNDLYPEKGPGWGVDDGYGYDTGRQITMTNGKVTTEKHTWIACYNHWAHMGTAPGGFGTIANNLIDAYLMTGDVRYGRLGAILIDRFADIYPDFDLAPYAYFITTGEHYMPQGKLRDYVWESGYADIGIRGYDAFYDMYDDPYVIDFLTKKAHQYDLGENKQIAEGESLTSGMIRENCEDGLLRETNRAIKGGEINGNFGTQHAEMALAAVVLDNFPETQEWIDWCFQTGHGAGVWHSRNVTGGNIDNVVINEVDRDGLTRETSPGYSTMWAGSLARVAEILGGYEAYTAKNMFDNSRYVKTIYANMPLVMAKRMTVPIGDTGNCASDIASDLNLNESYMIMGYQFTQMPIFAQTLYFINGDSAEGLHYDVYTKDPERLETEVADVIAQHGEYDFFSSTMLPDYGVGILRSGEIYDNLANGYYNNTQDFWIHFGHNTGHAHADMMNLGIDAFGLDIAPELGYPISSIGDECSNWGQNTIAHNTVVVDKLKNMNEEGGEPLHFDDAGRVKVMDMEGAKAMTQPKVDTYRRTVVMIQATEEISYGIDFFRVVGGNEHVYSFHALSDELTEDPTGITLVSQTDKDGNYVGTYAGADIPYKTEGITSGYSYLYNIDKAINPGVGEFEVDFKIKDFRKTLPVEQDMHLRMSMLNEDPVEEVVIANGEPAKKSGNPDTLKFMLVRNMGGESLFTTVMEPYGTERYLADSVQLPRSQITHADGSPISDDEVVRAIKVIFNDGRVDYVLYALDNSVEYKITDEETEIPFKGFVGVYTVDKYNQNVYSYVNDGTKLGDMEAVAEYTGNVNSFTKTLEFDNYINVSLNGDVKAEELVGRYVYIAGEGYEIDGAEDETDGSITLAIGDSSIIKSRADDGTYSFHMQEGDGVRIPLSAYEDTAPVITNANKDYTVAAGSKFELPVTATSPAGQGITLSAVDLPRGASFDGESGTVRWTPDSNQLGEHLIAVKADDGALQSIAYFTVSVVRSAGSAGSVTDTPATDTGNSDAGTDVPDTPSSDTGSGSGSGAGGGGGASGGGGGGGSSSGGGMSSGDTTDSGNTSGDNTDAGDGGSDVPSEKFIDLGGYDWAKEHIYDLVDAGVVNGTSYNTYSPSANIKRADFAIMLVRAFGITEGEGENFVDVDPNKYYAEELRLAKSAGIVNGIGENKFNPEGEITRQDMMLMLSRALDAVEYELSEADQSVLAQFTDAASISDYAKDAVSRVVRDGIIAGANGRINPLAKATRAEVAVMLNRVLKK